MDYSQKERIITAKKSFKDYWSEIFDSRELFWILAKRDVIVKYKQTVLGIAWALIRPLITAAVMVFAFGYVGRFAEGSSINYMLVVMPGVITWLFFSQSLTQVSMSIVQNSNLIGKVYFPRLIIPFSSFLIGLIDALIAFGLFLLLCVFLGFTPDLKILLFPIFLILTYFTAFGFGLFASVLNVKYRDVGQIIPFIIQFGYIGSPVAYPTSKVAASVSHSIYQIYALNPVVGLIDCMRWSLLGDYIPFNWTSFIPLIIFIIVSSTISFFFFRKHENSFVDYI